MINCYRMYTHIIHTERRTNDCHMTPELVSRCVILIQHLRNSAQCSDNNVWELEICSAHSDPQSDLPAPGVNTNSSLLKLLQHSQAETKLNRKQTVCAGFLTRTQVRVHADTHCSFHMNLWAHMGHWNIRQLKKQPDKELKALTVLCDALRNGLMDYFLKLLQISINCRARLHNSFSVAEVNLTIF